MMATHSHSVASVEVNGARLACVEAGRGDPLVFVHGSLEDLRIWRRQVAQFSAGYRAVAYSRRYHYPNAAPCAGDPPYTAGLHAADLAGLIEALGLAPAHLVCSSFGGCVALLLAVQRPELVRSLILAEPPLIPWLPSIPGGAPLAEDFLNQAWEPARCAFCEGDLKQGVRFFHAAVMGRGTFDRLSPAGQRMILDNAAEMRAETLADDYFPTLTPADAARIDRPVLLLNGALSPRLFHVINAELARCLPRAAQAVIPHASHVIHAGNPAVYHAAVREFWGGIDG